MEKSRVELAWERRLQAGHRFESLCEEHHIPGTSKGALSAAGHTLLVMQEKGSVQELVTWVEENCKPWFPTEENRKQFVEVAIENRRSSYAVREELTKVIAEDRGWPHRSFLYFDRLCPGSARRNPQHCFLGLAVRAFQEGHDPDRYVPDTNRGLVTLVGKLFAGPRRFEAKLTPNMTVADLTARVSAEWACDPACTTIGYHGRPFRDASAPLAGLGVVAGTLLHIMPGWATVEAMRAVQEASAVDLLPSRIDSTCSSAVQCCQL